MGPVRIRHHSHDFGWQSSHSVDLAGWQAKMASIEIWIPWHNAHKPHNSIAHGRDVALMHDMMICYRTHVQVKVCMWSGGASKRFEPWKSCVCVKRVVLPCWWTSPFLFSLSGSNPVQVAQTEWNGSRWKSISSSIWTKSAELLIILFWKNNSKQNLFFFFLLFHTKHVRWQLCLHVCTYAGILHTIIMYMHVQPIILRSLSLSSVTRVKTSVPSHFLATISWYI